MHSNCINLKRYRKMFWKIFCNGPITKNLISVQQYKIFYNDQYYINCDNQKNNCFSFENGQTMSILNFIKFNKIYAVGKMLLPERSKRFIHTAYFFDNFFTISLGIGIMFEDSCLQAL